MTTIPPEIPILHDETAKAMMTTLRNLAQSIPGFTFVSPDRRRKINVSASLPDEFLQAVAIACEASPHLASATEVDGAELREAISFGRAFSSLADELELVARGIRGTVALHRAEVGVRALRAYALAKNINRPDDREVLIPHITNMRTALGRAGVAKKKGTKPDDKPNGGTS